MRREELKAAKLEEDFSIDETEEEIIDDFLSYWADPDQLDNMNSCIFIIDNCDVITGVEKDVQSCEAVTSMEKYSEEESGDAFVLRAMIAQEEVLVDAKEVNQFEALISESTVETIELCDSQTDKLCMNAGTVSGDDMLQQCHREIALLQYLLENLEYDREIAAVERFQYSERKQKDIMERDDVRRRLVNNLEDSSENSLRRENQHTDVLMEMENSEQHTEALAKGKKALMPYDFFLTSVL